MARNRRRYALLGLAALAAAILVIPNLRRWLEAPPADRLERQAQAMRRPYRSDVDLLTQAPHYTIAATVDPDNGRVTGEMTVHYTHRGAVPLDALPFRLYPNAATIYGGGSLTVTAAHQDGQPLTSTLGADPTLITVTLSRPVEPGAGIALDLTFDATVPAGTRGGYGIFARNRGLLSLAGWYPIIPPRGDDGRWQTPPVPRVGDAMVAAAALYDVALTVPAGYTVVATGTAYDRPAADQAGDAAVTWRFASGPAREFAAAVSDRLATVETEAAGVTLRLHTLPASGAVTAPEEALAIAARALQVYTDRYGPYRYGELDVVHAVVSIGGYEFPGMVYVEAAKRTAASGSEYAYLLTHEMAHQWWYAQVGSRTVAEPWFDEGLATYSTALYRNADGSGDGDALVRTWQRRYGSRRPGDPPVNSAALDFRGWYGYRRTVYIHGALFLDALREEIGDDAFFGLLRELLAAHRYQVIDTATFRAMAQDAADQDLDDLFAAWFE